MKLNLSSNFLFLVLIFLLFIPTSKAQTTDQHIKVVLRTIGHEFLLQLNDSTSRVLPVKKIHKRYAIQFEKAFSFEPDLLFKAVYKVLKKHHLNDRFIVEVEKCNSNEVIHSFEASLNKHDVLMPCKLRKLPKDCFIFYVTLMDNDKFIFHNSPINNTSFNYKKLVFITLGSLALLLLYFKLKKPQLNLDLIQIGKLQFDKKRMVLIDKQQIIELSNIEADLLLLLFTNENQTLERDLILKNVWDDQGNYVGRTLDVFISKLRKKLETDPNLKIINIRGVGYKFMINK